MKPRQNSLFAKPTTVRIKLDEGHELVRMEKELDWNELMIMAEEIRNTRIKGPGGPELHWRELLGAVTLMAVKRLTFRDAEDMIAHYAPARYLCGLMDTDWTPDHVSVFEFTQMMGPSGMERLNQHIVKIAISKGFADPSVLMSDTTAQEAKIPYPNEVGLMGRYAGIVDRLTSKAGAMFNGSRKAIKKTLDKIKGLVRGSHLFAKDKTSKVKIAKKLMHTIEDIHHSLHHDLSSYERSIRGKAAQELARITEVMNRLLPQIKYFLDTGFVAPKKVIHLIMDDLYSIVRGKAGKSVEFGLKWGINRLYGGFVMGFLMTGRCDSDTKFCMEALRYHQRLFDCVPETYGFDRGGYSRINITKAKKMGVINVGIAPKGKAEWTVNDAMRRSIVNERAQVEGNIGTMKKGIYGFNKPEARSTRAMEICGQRAFAGMNLRKLVRELIKIEVQAATA